MTTPTRQAARLLWQHRQAGTVIDALPAALRPTDAAAGLAIQAELPAVADDHVIGWKIAATSGAGQAHIGVSGPLPGRILAGFVHPVGDTVPLAGNRMRVAEPEIAFRFAVDLPPQAAPRSVGEVLAAVASVHPAFEVPDSRLADFARAGEAQLLADDACCGRFVFGAAAPEGWRQVDLASLAVHASVIDADGRPRLARDGSGAAVLGDPRIALAWLVNALSAQGLALRAGDTVSTGTCMVPLVIAPGDEVRADYGPLGRLVLRLGG
jgi:2-keto-4-pentenoate hydratase